MVKPEKFDHLHLVYHFRIPLNDECAEYYLSMNTPCCPKIHLKHLKILPSNSLWNTFKQTAGPTLTTILHNVTNSLFTNKVLLKNHQIVIPKKLQHLILQTAQSQHQGIQMTKNLLC